MKHFASPRFWEAYDKLPLHIRKLADKNFEILKSHPENPNLRLKKVGFFGRHGSGRIIGRSPKTGLRGWYGFGSDTIRNMTNC